ncbi:hypothetical protein LZ554_000701 [Drepanopeziza brunnea f. sp. 'monogermtubi']|nr:hypothetical protein LZ554_000701 [Drepanopeziza brunnea f. sp. 'monogermtubi']
MATANPDFLALWRNEAVQTGLISHLDTSTLCALRLVSSECSDLTTAPLFARTRLTFTPSSLTRPSRLQALSRVGRYIQHLTFSMSHTPATFLSPLVNPSTGREVNFLYTPHTSGASFCQRPKYGSPELGDLLTQQYPPIFHAATNVPAFVKAMTYMPNLRHLTISCPDQDPVQRYRRDAVDYALISLRIAIERAPVERLEKLSLKNIHPSGLVYLRHMPGFGCTPSAGRRWKQIKKLSITMDAWDFYGARPGRDHLKILDDYIRAFSANLEKVSFGWSGQRGPCPLTLFTDPLFAPPRTTKLFAEVTSPMSPLPAAPLRPAITFPKLKYMQIRNASMSTEQVSNFVLGHRHTVREFDFENVILINCGEWEDALSPLARASSSDEWLSHHSGSETGSSTCFQNHDDLDQLGEFDEVIDTAGGVPSGPVRTSVLVKKKRVHKRRRKHRRKEASGKLVISDPIPITRPIEEVLVPEEVLLMPTMFNPNVQGVQRDTRKEAAQQELADDPDKRVSALKKAKEAVLKQLGKEYCRNHERKENARGFLKNTYLAGRKGRALMGHHESTALVPLMFSRY